MLAMAQSGTWWKRLEPIAMQSRWVRYPVLAGLLAAAACLAANPDGSTLNWRIGLLAMLCITLVWLGSYGRGYICAEGRCKDALMWVGSRSYAIYLVHIPAYYFVRECFWRLGMADSSPPYLWTIYAATAMLLVGLMAEANFRWVEAPFRERGARLAHRLRQSRVLGNLQAARPPALP